MNPTSTQPEFLLLFRNATWHHNLPPVEVEKIMADWMAWFDGLVADGRCRGGQSLTDTGHVVAGTSRTVTDGPYAEAKESVIGYFILTVSNIEDALHIAKFCPGLPHELTVEVRELRPRCASAESTLAAQSHIPTAPDEAEAAQNVHPKPFS